MLRLGLSSDTLRRTMLIHRTASKHKQYNTQVDVGYYAPAAQTTLNSRVFLTLKIRRVHYGTRL